MMISFKFWIYAMSNDMMQHIPLLNLNQNTEHIWNLKEVFHTLLVVIINKFWLEIIFMVMQIFHKH